MASIPRAKPLTMTKLLQHARRKTRSQAGSQPQCVPGEWKHPAASGRRSYLHGNVLVKSPTINRHATQPRSAKQCEGRFFWSAAAVLPLFSQRERYEGITRSPAARNKIGKNKAYFRPTKRTRKVVARPWPPAKAPKHPDRTRGVHAGASILFTTESGFCRPTILTPATRTAHK